MSHTPSFTVCAWILLVSLLSFNLAVVLANVEHPHVHVTTNDVNHEDHSTGNHHNVDTYNDNRNDALSSRHVTNKQPIRSANSGNYSSEFQDYVMVTTKGNATIRVYTAWSPLGASRFNSLVDVGYFDENAFFRVMNNASTQFVAQWGINGDPTVSKEWNNREIENDPVVASNIAGTLTYAAAYKNNQACCRTTQLFVNYANNSQLDASGFSPFAEVQGDGMEVLNQIYTGYWQQPNQNLIYRIGNSYLKNNFPLLDYIITVVKLDD